MPLMISRRRLEEGDFDAWKERFEAGSAAREAAGCRNVRRFRGVEDPRELMIIFDWDTVENARGFVAMKVSEKPELVEMREGGAGPKLDNIFMEEMPPLES